MPLFLLTIGSLSIALLKINKSCRIKLFMYLSTYSPYLSYLLCVFNWVSHLGCLCSKTWHIQDNERILYFQSIQSLQMKLSRVSHFFIVIVLQGPKNFQATRPCIYDYSVYNLYMVGARNYKNMILNFMKLYVHTYMKSHAGRSE